jgi:hypothetical protein
MAEATMTLCNIPPIPHTCEASHGKLVVDGSRDIVLSIG